MTTLNLVVTVVTLVAVILYGRRIMAGIDDLKTELAAVDTEEKAIETSMTQAETNMTAAIARLEAGGLSDADAQALADHLKVTLGQFQTAQAGLDAATTALGTAELPPTSAPATK